MKETIYTIPVNNAFDRHCGCPICSMYDELEENEIERVTGAAMMEPDVRLMTNSMGFCKKHLKMMAGTSKALPVALLLESHIEQLKKLFTYQSPNTTFTGKVTNNPTVSLLHSQNNKCYVCRRIDDFFEMEIKNLFYMFEEDDFKKKLKKTEFFCLPHLELLLKSAQNNLKKKKYEEFARLILEIDAGYFDKLSTNVSKFCNSFDYTNSGENIDDCKDCIEKSINSIT